MIQELLENLIYPPNKEATQKTTLQEEFAEELGRSLGPEYGNWVQSLPQEIFEQIEALHQPGILNPDQQKNHWDYELNMIRAIVSQKSEILQQFGVTKVQEQDFIKELLFMVMISDIGKAGPKQYDANSPEAVVPRFYNNLILEKKHGKKVSEIGIQELFQKSSDNAYGSTKVTQRVRKIIYKISGVKSVKQFADLVLNTNFVNQDLLAQLPEQVRAILVRGEVLSLPIEFALIVARKIAITEILELQISNSEKRKKIGAINKCFQLSSSEKKFLLSQGFDVETTPIGNFYSNGHINFGKEFLLSPELKLNARLQNRALLGLRHHFSQGVFPDSREEIVTFISQAKKDISARKEFELIAFLEILDKVEAAFNRSQEPRTQETLNNILYKRIIPNVKTNFPQEQTFLIEVYSTVFSKMQKMGIFTRV